MAKRKMIVEITGDTSANSDGPSETNLNDELPFFRSPSVSPAESEPTETAVSDIAAPAAATAIPEAKAAGTSPDEINISILERAQTTLARVPRLVWRPRYKRHAVLAASVTVAAAIGAIAGIAATGGFSKPEVSVAVQDNRAVQRSIARLSLEVNSLKASLDTANKSAHAQFAKLGDRLNLESADVTNSAAARTVPTEAQASTPLPAPRPPSAAEAARATIVLDWSIREMRDGYVYVEGHGEIYQVVPGAPLPGLGPVEQIKRQDGRWVVVTPKGIIVSMRDRHYFGQF